MHFTVVFALLQTESRHSALTKIIHRHWHSHVRFGRKQKYSWLILVLNLTIHEVKTTATELYSINCKEVINIFTGNCWHRLPLYFLTYINSSNKMHLLSLFLFKPWILIPYLTLFFTSTRLSLLGPELHLKHQPLPTTTLPVLLLANRLSL